MLENGGFFAGFLQGRKRLTPLKSEVCSLLMINERQLVNELAGILLGRSQRPKRARIYCNLRGVGTANVSNVRSKSKLFRAQTVQKVFIKYSIPLKERYFQCAKYGNRHA